MPPLASNLTVAEAEETDLQSMATIHTRSFHPTNAFHRKVMPDTPAMREWWVRGYRKYMDDPTCRVLIVRDANASSSTVGILKMKRFEPGERGAGGYDDLCPDIDLELFAPAVQAMAEYRERLMLDRPHYMIEFFGTDNKYQGTGVGTALLGRCCEMADAAGIECFVEANYLAEGFYRRLGFVTQAEIVMGGQFNYRQHLMLRPTKT